MGVVGRAGPPWACHSLQGPPCRGDSEAESGARRLPLVSAWMRVWGHSGRCAVHIKRTSLRSRKRWQQGLAVAGGPPGPGVDAEACSAQDGRPLAVGSLPCSSGTLWNGAQDSRARPGACLCVAVPLWPDVHVLTFPFTTVIDFFPLLKCLGYSRKFRKHR